MLCNRAYTNDLLIKLMQNKFLFFSVLGHGAFTNQGIKESSDILLEYQGDILPTKVADRHRKRKIFTMLRLAKEKAYVKGKVTLMQI